MKSRSAYSSRLMSEINQLRLSLLEKVLIGSLVFMCLISVISTMTGRDVGNAEQLKLAKQQAQQDLMALRTAQPR
jgi:hypothetical protein